MLCLFTRLTWQPFIDNYLEIFKITGCYINILNWSISIFNFNFAFLPSHHFSGMHHPERGAAFSLSNLDDVGLVLVVSLLLLWFVGFSFRNLNLHLKNGREGGELYLDSRAAIWWALLHSCNLDKDTVQRWRPGTAPLPAASQELLTGRSLGTGAFLETVVALREGWLKAETAFSGAWKGRAFPSAWNPRFKSTQLTLHKRSGKGEPKVTQITTPDCLAQQ